jgi:hypothetical protein
MVPYRWDQFIQLQALTTPGGGLLLARQRASATVVKMEPIVRQVEHIPVKGLLFVS